VWSRHANGEGDGEPGGLLLEEQVVESRLVVLLGVARDNGSNLARVPPVVPANLSNNLWAGMEINVGKMDPSFGGMAICARPCRAERKYFLLLCENRDKQKEKRAECA
jgi:hypothetical protein